MVGSLSSFTQNNATRGKRQWSHLWGLPNTLKPVQKHLPHQLHKRNSVQYTQMDVSVISTIIKIGFFSGKAYNTLICLRVVAQEYCKVIYDIVTVLNQMGLFIFLQSLTSMQLFKKKSLEICVKNNKFCEIFFFLRQSRYKIYNPESIHLNLQNQIKFT